MLHLYRRHLEGCGKRQRKASCACPVWVQGSLHGTKMRKSLGIRSWEAAQALVRDWEARRFGSITVTQAWDRFLADCVARGLRKETIGKYQLLEREMCGRFGERSVDSVRVEELAEYRETW